jgi:hypothetical protein
VLFGALYIFGRVSGQASLSIFEIQSLDSYEEVLKNRVWIRVRR